MHRDVSITIFKRFYLQVYLSLIKIDKRQVILASISLTMFTVLAAI